MKRSKKTEFDKLVDEHLEIALKEIDRLSHGLASHLNVGCLNTNFTQWNTVVIQNRK